VAGYIRSGQEQGRHFADVDPEAYVVHVLQFVVTATAAAAVTAAAIDPDSADGRARYERELARIAKASLFPPPRAGSGGRGGPARRASREG
jgi:hypothetical protein